MTEQGKTLTAQIGELRVLLAETRHALDRGDAALERQVEQPNPLIIVSLALAIAVAFVIFWWMGGVIGHALLAWKQAS